MIGKMTCASSASLIASFSRRRRGLGLPAHQDMDHHRSRGRRRSVLAEGPSVTAEHIAGPFEVPFSVALLPDGSFLVTERPGRLKRVKLGADSHEVTGVPAVLYLGHGGLLDIAVDPDFNSNAIVYLSYLQGDETALTIRVMRARFDEENEMLVDGQAIFEGNPGPRPSRSVGGSRLTATAICSCRSATSGTVRVRRISRTAGLHRAHQDRRIDPR